MEPYPPLEGAALEKAGFHVIRFSDNEILKDMSNVILRIESFIEDWEKSTPRAPASGG